MNSKGGTMELIFLGTSSAIPTNQQKPLCHSIERPLERSSFSTAEKEPNAR